ncbi:MAG: LptF/LptG family permease [Bacteroidia bacterium]|nr:LptF/LptG family permease [Bacteroidia bacterium]
MSTFRITKLDRYIIGQFLVTYFFAIALIVGIAVVFDVSEKLEDFIKRKPGFFKIIFEYYIYFIPYFANLFSSLFIFVAVIFFTSRMAYRTEIVAILNSGISFWRFLYPYFIGATILTVMSILLTNFVIPPANKHRLDFEDKYINNLHVMVERDYHRQSRPGDFVYLESYNPETKIGTRFALERIKNGKLVYKISSENIKWDTLKKQWTMDKYYERFFTKNGEKVLVGKNGKADFDLLPEDFTKRLTNIKTLNYWELDRLIEKEKLKGGTQLDFYLMEKYERITMPFAAFILTVIGVSLSSRKVRGGIGLQIGFGLALSFSYILFSQVAGQFALAGSIPIWLGVWIPNLLFSVLALVLVRYAPK